MQAGPPGIRAAGSMPTGCRDIARGRLYHRAMSLRLILAGICLIAGSTNGAAMASTPPLPVQCMVTGAKLLAPMTASAICQRFVAAFGQARGTPVAVSDVAPADGLVVRISFAPRGIASAAVTVMHRGKAATPVSFNLAVSDRPFGGGDVDTLAASMAAGLRTDSVR